MLLRPVQRAVKEVSQTINHSPIYKGSLRSQSQSQGQPQLGATAPPTPVPPMPLSAALGPAAQATVPSTPGILGIISPAEMLYSHNYSRESVRERERSDAVSTRYGRR